MRIPKILQKFRNTRLWRYKWKILAMAPFVLAILVFTTYSTYNYLAERSYKQFVDSWDARGETIDLNQLIDPAPVPDQDFFQHPAVMAELNGNLSPELNSPDRASLKGFSHEYSDYQNNRNGNYQMGVPDNIHHWLQSNKPKRKTSRRSRRGRRGTVSPAVATSLSEVETAHACLSHLEIYNTRLMQISEASQRPSAYFGPMFDSNGDPSNHFDRLQKLTNLSRLLKIRGILNCRAQNAQAAAKDFSALLNNYRVSSHKEGLVGYLFSLIHLNLSGSILWDGLRSQLWDDATLKSLDLQLRGIDEPKRLLKNMRQEVGHMAAMTQKMIDDPQYLQRQREEMNKTFKAAFGSTSSTSWDDVLEELLYSAIPHGLTVNQSTWTLKNLENILFYPSGEMCDRVSIRQAKQLEQTTAPWPYVHANMGDLGSLSWMGRQIERSLQAQANVHNMRTAIALERFRLQHNKYPKSLDQLVPEYLPCPLEDVITGQPLHYRLKNDGTPLIYSIGSNQTDDQGKPHRAPERGDWAWMYSPPKGFTYDDFRRSH